MCVHVIAYSWLRCPGPDLIVCVCVCVRERERGESVVFLMVQAGYVPVTVLVVSDRPALCALCVL